MPFFRATYASNVGKIFATMGPYICRCSATTGQLEAVTKLAAAPIYGNMSIIYHSPSGMLFVGAGDTPNKQISDPEINDPPQYQDLFQVNPNTMAIVSTGIQSGINAGFGPTPGLRGGPYALHTDGNYVYFLYRFNNVFNEWGRIEIPGFAYNGGDGFRWSSEQITSGSAYSGDYVYRLDPRQLQLEYFDKTGVQPNGGFIDGVSISPHTPLGMCLSTSDSNIWIVCGDENLLRVDALVDLNFTVFNLTAVTGPTVTPDPCRIQCIGGLLYMPCMSANGIIIHTPGAAIASATWKGGFENPIDVVSTGSKLFAVQNSPIGLKEIL